MDLEDQGHHANQCLLEDLKDHFIVHIRRKLLMKIKLRLLIIKRFTFLLIFNLKYFFFIYM